MTDDVMPTDRLPQLRMTATPTGHTGEMPDGDEANGEVAGDELPADELVERAPVAGEQADGAVADSDSPTSTGGSVSADQAKLVLRRVKDPELNLNIVDLGLIYDISVDGSVVRVDMSLTSPGCPSGPEIMGEAEQQLRTIPGVSDVVMNLIWSPPWTPERIEPRVRAYMGF